ncbi:uncharacterized protein LOC122262208 [Penaeus japonicus]|uniref:uncharacterized protein LOC122262208 n=1 Tax=Penaeus japonicus TaxID=27405 RepID=UPI001C70B809|nr:uncharacterized protein LOC122262208 [Penaeus japonicus]XP_042886102.1 uncharacterized protein LOC122262208 [Penaeus japonicus]
MDQIKKFPQEFWDLAPGLPEHFDDLEILTVQKRTKTSSTFETEESKEGGNEGLKRENTTRKVNNKKKNYRYTDDLWISNSEDQVFGHDLDAAGECPALTGMKKKAKVPFPSCANFVKSKADKQISDDTNGEEQLHSPEIKDRKQSNINSEEIKSSGMEVDKEEGWTHGAIRKKRSTPRGKSKKKSDCRQKEKQSNLRMDENSSHQWQGVYLGSQERTNNSVIFSDETGATYQSLGDNMRISHIEEYVVIAFLRPRGKCGRRRRQSHMVCFHGYRYINEEERIEIAKDPKTNDIYILLFFVFLVFLYLYLG